MGKRVLIISILCLCFFVFGLICCDQDGASPETESPQLIVKQGEIEIPAGTGSYDFGSIGVDEYTGFLEGIFGVEIPFTIENTGTVEIEINDISISTDNGDNFILSKETPAEISPGATSSFSIRFDPGNAGTISELVHIDYNDSSDTHYTFTVKGTGIPVIDVMKNSNIYCFDDVSIAIDGTNVYAAYCVYYSSSSSDLLFAKSIDSGVTWSSENKTIVDGNGGRSTSMVFQNDTLYISYFDEASDDLKFAKSTNGGADWSSTTVEADAGDYNDIAVNGDTVFISYYDWVNFDLKVAMSSNGGDNWYAEDITIIESDGNTGKYTSIAVNGDDVYLAYFDESDDVLKFIKSTDNGASWLPEDAITIDFEDGSGENLDMAINGSTIYIVYETVNLEESSFDVKLARSTDGGDYWPYIISLDSSGDLPEISVDGTTLYVTYKKGDLKFITSTNGGTTFEEVNDRIIDENVSGWCNSLAINGNTIFACYSDFNENGLFINDVLKIARSINGGETW